MINPKEIDREYHHYMDKFKEDAELGKLLNKITYRIEPGALWVLSTYNPRSLDSRYIGPIQADTVIAGMTPVFVFNQKENYALDRR